MKSKEVTPYDSLLLVRAWVENDPKEPGQSSISRWNGVKQVCCKRYNMYKTTFLSFWDASVHFRGDLVTFHMYQNDFCQI